MLSTFLKGKSLQFFYGCFLLFLASCGSIRQNILFDTDQTVNGEVFRNSFEAAAANYRIQVNDHLAIAVFTNNGERLIDPNQEFKIGESPNNNRGNLTNNQNLFQIGFNTAQDLRLASNNAMPVSYLVDQKGNVALPMVGEVALSGLTLGEAQTKLKELYSQFYEEPFVVAQYLNKRVVLMGALGDQVIPLRNENMTLLEILSIAGNVQTNAKVNNVRLIRGPWDNPSIKLIDLTTVNNLKDANIIIEPNDIIYLEPRRRIDRESIQDFNIIFAPLTTLITLSLTILLFIRETRG